MPKTILVTGATDGIGLLTAKTLAADGHTILLHGRSEKKLAAAAAETGGTNKTYCADLSSLAEVGALGAAIRSDHDCLDVLINNAGVLKAPNVTLECGLDIRFVVNTYAPYLLTQCLLPIIPADGRVVNLSSAAQARVDFDAMCGTRDIDDISAYAQSKLAITIWTRELAKTLPNGPVIVAVNPGSFLGSKMVKEGFGIPGKDLSIGADILCEAALGDSFAGASGAYFDNDSRRFSYPDPAAQDRKQAIGVMQIVQGFAHATCPTALCA